MLQIFCKPFSSDKSLVCSLLKRLPFHYRCWSLIKRPLIQMKAHSFKYSEGPRQKNLRQLRNAYQTISCRLCKKASDFSLKKFFSQTLSYYMIPIHWLWKCIQIFSIITRFFTNYPRSFNKVTKSGHYQRHRRRRSRVNKWPLTILHLLPFIRQTNFRKSRESQAIGLWWIGLVREVSFRPQYRSEIK